MARAYILESAIQQQLRHVGTCSLDELMEMLPSYSWAQIFAAVDRLTRDGAVTLQHPTRFRYVLSLGSGPSSRPMHDLAQASSSARNHA